MLTKFNRPLVVEHFNMQYNLEEDMRTSPELVVLLKDDEFCRELWTAFANITWYKAFDPMVSDGENIHAILTDDMGDRTWGASFRTMGGVIADLRNELYDLQEDYMSWYCSNYSYTNDEATQNYDYGFVSHRVRAALLVIGWKPVEDEYYAAANN